MRLSLPVLASVMTCAAMGAVNGTRVGMVLLLLHLAAGAAAVGALLGVFSAMSMLLSIPIGRVIDRSGFRRPLACSLFLVCAGIALVAASQSLMSIYVAAMITGFGSIGITICLTNVVGLVDDPVRRARGFAIYTIGVTGSNAIGPMLAGVAIDHFGFAGGFWFLGVLGVTSVALFAVSWRRFPSEGALAGSGGRRTLDLLADRALFPMYVAATLNAVMWDGFQFIAPVRGATMGLSAASIGILLGSFSTATIVIRFVMPLLASHFREWTLIAATASLGAIGYALLPFTTEFWSMVFVACVLGTGFGFGYPMILAVSFALSPKGREAEVSGARSALSSAVRFVMPLALGGLASIISVGAISWSIAMLMLGGSIHARSQLQRPE